MSRGQWEVGLPFNESRMTDHFVSKRTSNVLAPDGPIAEPIVDRRRFVEPLTERSAVHAICRDCGSRRLAILCDSLNGGHVNGGLSGESRSGKSPAKVFRRWWTSARAPITHSELMRRSPLPSKDFGWQAATWPEVALSRSYSSSAAAKPVKLACRSPPASPCRGVLFLKRLGIRVGWQTVVVVPCARPALRGVRSRPGSGTASAAHDCRWPGCTGKPNGRNYEVDRDRACGDVCRGHCCAGAEFGQFHEQFEIAGHHRCDEDADGAPGSPPIRSKSRRSRATLQSSQLGPSARRPALRRNPRCRRTKTRSNRFARGLGPRAHPWAAPAAPIAGHSIKRSTADVVVQVGLAEHDIAELPIKPPPTPRAAVVVPFYRNALERRRRRRRTVRAILANPNVPKTIFGRHRSRPAPPAAAQRAPENKVSGPS